MKRLLVLPSCLLRRPLLAMHFDAVRHVELVCYGSTWSGYHLTATLQLSTSGSVKNLRPSENG